MSTTVYLLTICLPLATVLLVFGMKYFAMVRQAGARTARDWMRAWAPSKKS